MITALLCRHYKIYKNLNFIPVSKDYNNPFSLYIGNNAVGKSSVLEALDCFFNDTRWNLTKNTKSNDSFIAPVFLINKNDLPNNILRDKDKEVLNKVSEFFWDLDDRKGTFTHKEVDKFYAHRDELLEQYDKNEYYLFVVGLVKNDINTPTFATFDSKIREVLSENDMKLLNEEVNLLNIVKRLYTFLYFPVELEPSDVLSIQNDKMQAIMSKDILEKIENILKDKQYNNDANDRQKTKKSIIDLLNENLNQFMAEINDTINNIDEDYQYKGEFRSKKNLTSSDIRDRVLEAYFSVRNLKKGEKYIQELSSGEQRVAIIDIVNSFLLNKDDDSERNVIIAIDEPENSLHISKLYSQFERLLSLSNNHQIILSSHWYGAIPFIDKGDIHFLEIDKKNKKDPPTSITTYISNQYFQSRKELPDDINLKSYFDLATSIIFSLRNEVSWIICEGSTDKRYIEYYMNNNKGVKILPVGGADSVSKLYDYLYLPLSEKLKEKGDLKGKILCIIDTDDKLSTITSNNDQTSHGELQIKRLNNKEGKPELISLSSRERSNAVIENVLDPKKYFDSIKSYIQSNEPDFSGNLVYNKERKHTDSCVEKEFESIIDKQYLEVTEIQKLYDILRSNKAKNKIVDIYTSNPKDAMEAPEIFKEINKIIGC